jgi:hypothetical protein
MSQKHSITDVGSVDGLLDPAELPFEDEPQTVRADLDSVRSLRWSTR